MGKINNNDIRTLFNFPRNRPAPELRAIGCDRNRERRNKVAHAGPPEERAARCLRPADKPIAYTAHVRRIARSNVRRKWRCKGDFEGATLHAAQDVHSSNLAAGIGRKQVS